MGQAPPPGFEGPSPKALVFSLSSGSFSYQSSFHLRVSWDDSLGAPNMTTGSPPSFLDSEGPEPLGNADTE